MSSVIEKELKPETKFCCRFLENSEYWKLVDIFEEYNDKIPKPGLSRIAVIEIEETSEIVGFFCIQLCSHSEPFWIKEEYRKSGLWVKLVEMILPLAKKSRTFIIAATPETKEMCERLGLKRIESPVYVREEGD